MKTHFTAINITRLVLILTLLISTNTLFAQKEYLIEIKNSNEARMDHKNNPDLTKFIGDVCITHKQIEMYCDSAYRHEKLKVVEAFGHVHIIQADTLHMWGDYLRYSAKQGMARVRKNVTLKDRNIILTTDSLDFNVNEKVGYYFNGGKIVDSLTNLTSIIGRYYTQKNMIFFKDSVKLIREDYTLTSDTLQYNRKSGKAFILGPTYIRKGDETLYSENGWYDTQNDISQLLKNSRFFKKEYSAKGDSIHLDQKTQIGKLYKNVELRDTVHKLIINANYLEAHKLTEEALVTDSLIFTQISKGDSLSLHSDSLRIEPDTAKFKRILAYHHVKFYRKNLQGKCDSLVYSLRDSTIRMYSNPILWSQGNQITADSIAIETHNNNITALHFMGNAFLCNKEDDQKFNQIKGKTMLGHVRNNELYQLDINGNGETLYYPKDKEKIIGVNISKSSNISIRIRNRKIDKIIFLIKPDGKLHPLKEMQPEKLFLKDFKWLEELKPKSRMDIFNWVEPQVPKEK